jgi:maltooligosyltrehalose trehalohydrolase
VFFADHRPDLSVPIQRGRAGHIAQFCGLPLEDVLAQMPDPASPDAFARCKLDRGERLRNEASTRLHQDLIALRRRDPVIRAQRPRAVDGAVLSSEAFLLRYFDEAMGDRLLLINLGLDLDQASVPEPLLAPPSGCRWETLWSSEDARYGGRGITAVHIDNDVFLPGASAVLLCAARRHR